MNPISIIILAAILLTVLLTPRDVFGGNQFDKKEDDEEE